MSAPVIPPPRSLVALLAFGTGLCVAALYYNQPILGALAGDLHASESHVGWVPMLTQLGYAIGIVATAPLGDRLDRRRVILAKCVALAVALIAAGLATSIAALAATSLIIGICATAAQDMVPAAAAIAPPEHRGKIVGSVMTGLLLGILLSRLASGAIADHLGWRAVFLIGAAAIAALTVLAAVRLPAFPPTTTARYGELLRSMLALVGKHQALRRAALTQGLLSLAFSAFWSTLTLCLKAPPFVLGATAAGAFGLAGAAGAIAAPIAGTIADRRGPLAVIKVGAALVIAAFALMLACQGSIAALIVGAAVFDLGVQAALISHQTVIYGIDPAARSRLNAVLVSSMFIGMAIGAALASVAFTNVGWSAVCELGIGAGVAALIVRSLPMR